jgi:protein-tyrosine phosphatase
MYKLMFFLVVVIPVCLEAQISDSSRREVKLQGAANFRDLGGYTTADGHHVRWGSIYRSADISKLTDSDMTVLNDRHISTVVDLRGVQESKQAPDRLPVGADYILCPAGSDSSLSGWMKQIASIRTGSGGDSMMRVYYSHTEFLAERYRPFFDKLLGLPDHQALLFHCTAGKDRTGIGAALLLYALGVSYDKILEDYTATNYYRTAENQRMQNLMEQSMHMASPVAAALMQARREYLVTTFDNIKQQYGSIDNFLQGPIGLDEKKRKALREKFLD